MKKGLVQIVAIACISYCACTVAREIRTPLPRRYAHYFLPEQRRIPLAFYYGNIQDGADEKSSLLNVDIWGHAWHRVADRAYSNKHGRKTTPLSRLLFCKSDFTGAESFAHGVANVPNNPWVNISTLRPRFSYNEKGALVGMEVARVVHDGRIRVGGRTTIPFRFICTDRFEQCSADNRSSELGGERLQDVTALRAEVFQDEDGNNQGVVTFAYRLDFLSQLNFTPSGAAVDEPLVDYTDADFMDHITIAHQDLSNQILNTNVNVVHAIQRNDGTVPPGTFGSIDQPGAIINGNGSGLTNNQRGLFDTQSYDALSNNTTQQNQLWIVPAIAQFINAATLSEESQRIKNAVDQLVLTLDDSAEDFFIRKCFCFETQKNVGLGDIDLDAFVQYFRPRWYVEGVLGVRIPSGKRLCDPNQLFLLPLGNNGHAEGKIGYEFGFDALDWFKIKTQSSFSFVGRRSEVVAAPFKGACVKNFGPCTEASISWWHYTSNLDLTFVNPDTQSVGFNLGYQLYWKSKDRIRCLPATAKDCLGVQQPLDPCLLEQCTKVVSHKSRVEFFCVSERCELYAGWTHVFAGKNAPRETDWYLGMLVTFK